jgi:predicted DNA-binding ribbon-helix-helix protein
MRTTVEIEDEVLSGLKDLARKQGLTLGQVISEVGRRSLQESLSGRARNGVRVFERKPGNEKSDMGIVNALRDDA